MKHKRGDTFDLPVVASDLEGPVDLTLVTIESKVRKANNDLLAELTVTKSDQTTNPGEFSISATGEETAEWPVGTYICDIRYTFSGGNVESSADFNIEVLPSQSSIPEEVP